MAAPVKVAGAVVLVGYTALVASVRSFTWPALALTAIAGVAVLVLTPRRPPERSLRPERGMALWVALAAAVIAWELVAYLQSPRDDYPTLSSLLDAVEAHRPLRGVLFLGWIALGRELVRR